MPDRMASSKLPHGVVHYRPDAEGWLRERGYLVDGQGIDDDARGIFHSTATRENAKLERGPRGSPVFEKLTRALTISDLQKVFRRGRRLTSPLLHEWKMLWDARERGVRVPEPVAAGARRGLLFPRSDFLITEALPGRSVFDVLDDAVLTTREENCVAIAVGRAVAGLHAAGIAFPDLFAKHVFLEQTGNGDWNVGFLDLTSACVRPKVSRAERARDLGALVSSLPFRVSPRRLARFLRSYLRDETWDRRDAWNQISKRAREYLKLRRFRSSLTGRAVTPPGKPGPDPEARKRHLLRRFEVPVMEDPGVPAAIQDDLAEPLKRLLLATFRAGVLPSGDVLPHLRSWNDGELAWDVRAPLRAPRKARAIDARWRAFFLRREIARSGLSAGAKKSLIQWVGGAPIAAFALSDL